MDKPQGELNNKFLTQLKMSKSSLVRQAVIEFAKNKLEGKKNENTE